MIASSLQAEWLIIQIRILNYVIQMIPTIKIADKLYHIWMLIWKRPGHMIRLTIWISD